MTFALRLAMRAAALLLTLFVLPPAVAQRKPFGAERPCGPGVCVITVTVNDCYAPGGIVVDPDVASTRSPIILRWVMATSGYEFTDDGIDFEDPDQFIRLSSPRPNEFRFRNTRTRDGDFYYWVRVRGCREVDPFIRNN